MKRLGDIYESICDRQNLALAFSKVQKGKRYRPDICDWREHLEERLNELAYDLNHEEFRFGDYAVFQVHDPKERTIYAASVRERVIHHAVINVCGSRLENALIDDSYACRCGKGQLKAVHRAMMFANRNPWCLKLDIKSYFDSIDHERLMALLERKIKDVRLLRLFRALLDSYCTTPGKGLPIGNLTSQYFANLYLDAFDRMIAANAQLSYVRYMDDMLIFGEYGNLKSLLNKYSDFLDENLKLKIKGGGSLHRILPGGVDFLGYRVMPGFLLLNRRSKLRFRRKCADLEQSFLSDDISEDELQERLTALYAFVNHAKSLHFRGACLMNSKLTEK